MIKIIIGSIVLVLGLIAWIFFEIWIRKKISIQELDLQKDQSYFYTKMIIRTICFISVLVGIVLILV